MNKNRETHLDDMFAYVPHHGNVYEENGVLVYWNFAFSKDTFIPTVDNYYDEVHKAYPMEIRPVTIGHHLYYLAKWLATE